MPKPRKCNCGGCAYCLHRDRANQYRLNSKARKAGGPAKVIPVKYPVQVTLWETSDGGWHNDELSAYKHQLDLFMTDRG